MLSIARRLTSTSAYSESPEIAFIAGSIVFYRRCVGKPLQMPGEPMDGRTDEKRTIELEKMMMTEDEPDRRKALVFDRPESYRLKRS